MHTALRGPGVYVIFGSKRRVYVGETWALHTRVTIQMAVKLGLRYKIYKIGLRYKIYKIGLGTTKRERLRAEERVARCYRKQGYHVVNAEVGDNLRNAMANPMHISTMKKAILTAIKRRWPEHRQMLLDNLKRGNATQQANRATARRRNML